MPDLFHFTTPEQLHSLIAIAKAEDMGELQRDITSSTLIPQMKLATAYMRSRAEGVFCGGALFEAIAEVYDPTIQCTIEMQDGESLKKGSQVATFTGTLQSILAMERIALNFATHLSGIATLTNQYVRETQGSNAKIYDTRKTIPGLRGLAKYAVVCGGGANHRMGLHDAVLIKDNHLAHLAIDDLGEAVKVAVERAKQADPPPTFVEVEVDTLDQFRAVLGSGVDMVLLDNMTNEQLSEAVAIRNKQALGVELEASGGVTLQTVRGISQTGVDRIAVGAITHSAPTLDLGLDIES